MKIKDNSNIFDWSDLAFSSKKPINDLNAVFIAAPRELSGNRLKQIIKKYLPQGNIIFGISKESYVQGFDKQPQFKTLGPDVVKDLIDKINTQPIKNKVYIMEYNQKDLAYIFEKLNFSKVVLINGSWKYAFHTQKPFYVLVKRHLKYEMISPFADEQEAINYSNLAMKQTKKDIILPKIGTEYTKNGMLDIANLASKYSFDYNFQTGVSVGKKTSNEKYKLLGTSYNKVVPYQSYAMHHGASRETNLSPPHDLNHYDTVHAEVATIIKAAEGNIDLTGATIFINLLPCPPCSRMLSQTPIAELIYIEDHSDGYAVMMLEAAGKKVRRLIHKSERLA